MEGEPMPSVRHRRLAASSSSSSSPPSTSTPSTSTPSGGSRWSSSTSGSSSAGRSSQQRDDADDVGSTKDAGTCSYYAPRFDGCSEPRPCFDCLNFNVASETVGCMVNQKGKCVSLTGNYDAKKDFAVGQAANVNNSTANTTASNGPLFFRASDVQYCSANDAACTACRNTVFLEALKSATAVDHTTFCYGQSGCVCIAVCESTKWSELVGGTQCPDHSSSNSGSWKKDAKFAGPPEGIHAWEITLIVIAVLLAILIVVTLFQRRRDHQFPVWVQKVVKIFRKSPKQTATNTATTEVSVPVLEANSGSGSSSSSNNGGERPRVGGPKREGLSLFGWRVMREELIDNETHRLARVDEGERSPESRFVQFADTAPSAPSFDDDLSNNVSAPAAPSAPSFRDKMD